MVAETPDPLEQDYRTVFTSEAGEKVLRDLMQRSFFWGTSFDSSAVTMAHNEGRRDAILYIVNMVRKNLKQPTTYIDEAAQAETDYPPGQDQNA